MLDQGGSWEELDIVRRDYSVSWYRCPIKPERLRELTKKSDLKAALQAFGFLALLLALGTICALCQVSGHWLFFALSLFAFGTVASFCSLACHEFSHGTVFSSKRANAVFLRIFATLSWFDFHIYKLSHSYHHLYTLHPRGDREVLLPKKPDLAAIKLLQLFSLSLVTSLESAGFASSLVATARLAFAGTYAEEWPEAVLRADGTGGRSRSMRWARFLLVFHAAVAALALLSGLWSLALMIVCGSFIANWLKYFVGVPMHVGLMDNSPDFRLCVRTIKLDPISRFLYWRMNYHTEHHMFGAVPCYNLRRLHKELAWDMPAPRSLWGAWREMRETWRRQRVEPAYQFRTPLPEASPGQDAPKVDPLGSSHGDLGAHMLE